MKERLCGREKLPVRTVDLVVCWFSNFRISALTGSDKGLVPSSTSRIGWSGFQNYAHNPSDIDNILKYGLIKLIVS